MSKFSLRVRGAAEILRFLDARNPGYAAPWKKALRLATSDALGFARSRAPVKSGALAAHLTTRLDARPVPRFGKVILRDFGGFRYGGRLEGDPTTKYRGGRYRNRKTRGWIVRALKDVRPRVIELLGGAAREIEATWGK